MSDRVTWLIPIKNGMPYLPETLASIEAQTYTNWEVLVWDNGSTDGTLEELEKWIPSRLPGRIITGEPHGVGGSLARMVEECQTELCARIDADDINLPNRLEEQVSFLTDHPEVAVVGSQMYFIDSQGVVSDKLYTVPLCHDDIVHAMLNQNSIGHPSVLFRRSVIIQVGNYQELPNVEDYDLWLRVAARYKLANLDKSLVRYRLHDRSTTRLAIRQQRIAKLLNDCISKNAPILYGCTEREMNLLREQLHPRPLPVLYEIAKHLQKNQGGEFRTRLLSNSFIQAAKNLVSPTDIISRLTLITLERKPAALPKELFSISKSLLASYPILRQNFNSLRHFKNQILWNRKLHKWLSSKAREGTSIHPTIDIIGGVKPDLEKLQIAPGCLIDKELTVWISEDEGANPKLVIKEQAYIARNTYIGIFQPISIGAYAQIGAYSYIISANHSYENRDIPIRLQSYVGAPIVIEDDAWLGTHVVVLPGVTIGKGAIVAAGSVVNRDIPQYEVWGGVPAKFLKNRP